MDGYSESNINTVIFDDSITDYVTWKKKRQIFASQLGQYLLDYNESQLSSVMASWESELARVSQIKTVKGNMSALLAFSILHFFFRSYDHVKKNFPMVNTLTSSENRDVCQAATTTLRYLAEENPDNYTFLRISLESVSSYLKLKGENKSLYNGLLILRQCGRFIPSDVFEITINTMPEIWSAICSPDRSLQKVAVKVINIHLRHVPSNTAESYAQSLAFDCFASLNSKKSSSYRGFILTLKSIFLLFPKAIDNQNLFLKLVNSLSLKTEEIPIETYKFLLLLTKNDKTVLSADQSLLIFRSLLDNLKMTSSFPTDLYKNLLDVLDSFIRSLPQSMIPITEIIDILSSSLNSNQNKRILNHFFRIFCTIIELFPQQKIPVNIFSNNIMCNNALHALRKRIDILMEIREQMMKTFNEGLNPKADFFAQKVSLRIFATFQNILFEKIDDIFPLLRHFAYSQNEKIRWLFASILHSFSCQEAIDEMVRMAMIDDSKKVRLCALNQIKAEDVVDKTSQLFQLLADTSYKVRRAAIPLIATAASLNPLYIVPQIILFVNNFLVTNVSYKNPARSAKTFSLMPLIAEHFVQFEPQFIQNLTWFCVWLLSHGNPIKDIPSQSSSSSSSSSQSSNYPAANVPINQTKSSTMPFTTTNESLPVMKNSCSFDSPNPETLGNLSLSIPDDNIHQIDLRRVIHRDFLLTTLGSKVNQSNKNNVYSSNSDFIANMNVNINTNSNSYPNTNINRTTEYKPIKEEEEQQQKSDSTNHLESHSRLLLMVYKVENSKWIAKCDSFLFNTLQMLSRYLRPYIYQVIPVFIYTFTYTQKDIVYLAALDALRQIIIEDNAEINLFAVFPYLLPSILRLIASSKSKEIIIRSLKLTGTIGVSSTVSMERDDENSYTQLISIQDMSFFTHFVLKLLCEHFKEPSASVCDSFSMIFAKDPANAMPFLEKVINAFISVINRETDVDVLFNELELIILHTKMNIVPYLNSLLQLLLSHLTNINCIRCCISLSYHLKTEFTDCATVLYPSTLHALSKNNNNLFFKTILRFISYSIIFQNQNPELFIEQVEILLLRKEPLDDIKTASMLITIKNLVQLRKLTVFSSRISRVCFSLLFKYNLNEVAQLILCLCQFEDLSIDMVELFLNNTGLKIPSLSSIRSVIETSSNREIQNFGNSDHLSRNDTNNSNNIGSNNSNTNNDGFNNGLSNTNGILNINLSETKHADSSSSTFQSTTSSSIKSRNSGSNDKKYSPRNSGKSIIYTKNNEDRTSTNFDEDNFNENQNNGNENDEFIVANSSSTTNTAMNTSKGIFKAPILTTNHLDYLVCESPIESAFTNLKQPVFNNARVWIDELCTRVVKNSPSVAIRSCVNAIAQSQSFRDELFPFAFLSCWMSTFRIQDKTQFSKTVVMILENFEKIDPIIINLADLADRVRFPLRVPDTVLAKASTNPCLSLYFLQRFLRDNPDSKSTIQSVLELNSRMGYLDSARGILIAYSSKLSELEKGKWYEQLGEWEKALEIFDKQIQNQDLNSIYPDKITALIQCYANLEMWDKIRALENVFEKMTPTAKKENALWFSCAEYHNNNIEKARAFLLSDHTNENIDIILYKTIYAIRSGDYEDASNYIVKGFQILAENNSIFDGSDASEATRSMVYAQHFVELNEALQMKKGVISSVHKIWQNRIKNFSHESDAWIRMIEVRGLVLRPQDHIESYLKMVSVLRKERKWRLIDSYCEKFLHNIKSPKVVISRLKNLWARGEKEEALFLIRLINKLFECNTESKFKKTCSNYIQQISGHISNISSINNDSFPRLEQLTFDRIQNYKSEYDIDQKFMARSYRIQANWQYKMYNSSTIKNISPLLALTKISRIFEKSKDLEPNDSRTWAGWAYANSRALSHASSQDRSKFAINAISGFLKATQLAPSESLEYLCQMFSIFFRYGVETKMNRQLHNDIVSLPPSIIVQIIPQIVVHIAHHDVNIRQLVQDVIYVFGSDHFETVVYPLNVLSMIDDSEISFTAKSFMNSLGMMHGHVPTYLDAQLLIQGMHKAAVSWIENWITTLETASKAQKRGNKEMVIKVLSKQFEVSDENYNKNFLFNRSNKLTTLADIINEDSSAETESTTLTTSSSTTADTNNNKLIDKETQYDNFLLIDQTEELNYSSNGYDEYYFTKRKPKSKHEKSVELCEFDKFLSRQYQNPLIQCRSAFEKYKNGNDAIVKQMWDNFRALYNEFGNQMKKITTIMLNKISPELANKRGFNLAIPGTYEVLKNGNNNGVNLSKLRSNNLSSASSSFYLLNSNNGSSTNIIYNNNGSTTNLAKFNNANNCNTSNNNSVNSNTSTNMNYQNSDIGSNSNQQEGCDGLIIPQLYYIEPELQVLSTQAHPRSVYMVDTFGNRCKFLLKGNEDLRLDQRIMQFFKLINSLLATNRNTSELGASISQYAVVPFAPNAGFISWVTGSDTLQALVSEYRGHWHIKKNVEIDIYTQFCGPIYNHLNSCQKHEVFNEVASKQNAGELREMLWLRSPSPAAWLRRSKNYTVSTALMSMAGYTIGLGDRHPSNIMIQKHTGQVIHIDFGDSFEVAMNRKTYKERVPFRLTRMILNALDGERVDGLFRSCCENVLWVLRENQSSIIAQLEVFVHEPIFYGREIITSEDATSMILERVSKKLNGKDPLPFDAPDDKVLNVEEQVSTLIEIAADSKEYDRHFLGWCPFW